MRKSEVNEILAQLYLRLNGYFTTGLILHSPIRGQARTEIDCFAIRHPFHRQSERCVETSDFLGAYHGETDLIFCEVKSHPDAVKFNQSWRNDHEAIKAALRWAGIFEEERVCSVSDRLQSLFQDDIPLEDARAGVVEGAFRVRALLCCPPCAEVATDSWCLHGTEIIRFADQCFNPLGERDSCSDRYNFQQWGYPFTPVVRYLKDKHVAGTLSLDGLYQHLVVELQQPDDNSTKQSD